MDKKNLQLLEVAAGIMFGACLGWFAAKQKYTKLAEEEIKSVKEKFTIPRTDKIESEKKPGGENSENVLKSDVIKSGALPQVHSSSIMDYAKYAKVLKDGEYVNYSDAEYSKDDLKKNARIVLISPDEYGEIEEYDQVSLTFYADGILADEDDTILEAEDVVGVDSLNHFGDYEDDAIHVRNDTRKVYYEVLMDDRSYKDATKKFPHRPGEED